MRPFIRGTLALAASGTLALAGTATAVAASAGPHAAGRATTTPIKHLVVIFQENISFDHYFGTYPQAANTDGQPFRAKPGTPSVNGLTGTLLTANPNGTNPRRYSPANVNDVLTCDQDHNYSDEQQAFDGGKMDKFVENTETDKCTGQPVLFGEPGLVMDYYDGNTVTALWNYAQHYAMSDAHFGSTFGPSTIGALNVIAGTTHGVSPAGAGVQGTMVLNSQPSADTCSAGGATMAGKNIGDVMNTAGVTWGWFAGGFRPVPASCTATHKNAAGANVQDYLPHHMPFQYYASTMNPNHAAPQSVANIGQTDAANHQYDLTDFDAPNIRDCVEGTGCPVERNAEIAGARSALCR